MLIKTILQKEHSASLPQLLPFAYFIKMCFFFLFLYSTPNGPSRALDSLTNHSTQAWIN